MRTVLIRLAELLALCVATSIVGNLVVFFGVIPADDVTFYNVILTASVIFFIVCNVFMLRRCFFELRSRVKYYLYNYIAYGIFMATTAVVYKIFGETVYAWLFNTLKILKFSEAGVHTIYATAAFHILMLAVIGFAPWGMDWVLRIKNAPKPQSNDTDAK